MDPSLLRLMEDLVRSIEQREASGPDALARDAEVRIHVLERELARRLAGLDESAALPMAESDEALAGVV
jgi:hypothetical protein